MMTVMWLLRSSLKSSLKLRLLSCSCRSGCGLFCSRLRDHLVGNYGSSRWLALLASCPTCCHGFNSFKSPCQETSMSARLPPIGCHLSVATCLCSRCTGATAAVSCTWQIFSSKLHVLFDNDFCGGIGSMCLRRASLEAFVRSVIQNS